jgi:uncharacterized membrane protein YebE (DUF533 family)
MSNYESTSSTGKGKLFNDSKVGNLVNGAIAAVLLYVGQAAGKLDLTPLPDVIEPIAVVAVATLAGLATSRAAARQARSAR